MKRPSSWLNGLRTQVSDRQDSLVYASLAVVLALIVLGVGTGLLFGQASPRESSQPENSANTVAPATTVAPSGRMVAKLIPDQRAYFGSPDTVIDLAHVFAEADFVQPAQLEFELLRNTKKKVVQARIENDSLHLDWGHVGLSELTVRATAGESEPVLDVNFQVEVWIADYGKLLMTVIGGLGIFLLGMKNMSEGLQAVAGGTLRQMISIATNNRLLATGVGVLVTIVIQSSTITTVMVVGFVNSGFMTLSQAVGVIMGANIGTTITGWILTLKIGMFGLPILGVGAIGYLFSKGDRVRYMAMAFMGLGMLFLGLELMKDGFGMVKELPAFEGWFERFHADTYWGVLKCAAVGCALTFLVQSSSATLGITISLAAMGVIPFETAAALVLGENVGTTVTAWLASFGATTVAKRAAYFHVLFNLIGVAWITALFIPFYIPLMRSIIGIDSDTGEVRDVTAAIALTHTCFNVANTLLFFPFAGQFARLLQHLIPEKPHKEKPHLTTLDVRVIETPIIAIEQSRVEVLRMGDSCNKMMDWLKTLLSQEEPDQKLVQKLFHREEVLDTIQDEIVVYITHLLSAHLPHTIIDEARRQLRMADEYESISDYVTSILKFHLKLRTQGHRFDQRRLDELIELHDQVADYLELVTQGYQRRQPEVITKAHSLGSAITKHVKELRDRHLDEIAEEHVEPRVNVAYTAALNSYRRVRDHALNIAEALAGEK